MIPTPCRRLQSGFSLGLNLELDLSRFSSANTLNHELNFEFSSRGSGSNLGSEPNFGITNTSTRYSQYQPQQDQGAATSTWPTYPSSGKFIWNGTYIPINHYYRFSHYLATNSEDFLYTLLSFERLKFCKQSVILLNGLQNQKSTPVVVNQILTRARSGSETFKIGWRLIPLPVKNTMIQVTASSHVVEMIPKLNSYQTY